MHESNICVFPLHRRRILVESIAQALETKNGEAASAFWRCSAKKMLIQFSDVGIAPELAAQEVGSLLHAVLDDMANRTVMHKA